MLGLDLAVHDHDGNADLSGPTPQHCVWINAVPEPKTVKHRVHLDVHAASIDEHVAWGATVLDADSFRWTVMADPEGGEYCLFVRDQPPAYRLYELAVDAIDAPVIAAWWGEVLGARIEHGDEGSRPSSRSRARRSTAIVFATVPEPKTVKNRIHVDVTTDDRRRAGRDGGPAAAPAWRRDRMERAWPTPRATSSAAFTRDRRSGVAHAPAMA